MPPPAPVADPVRDARALALHLIEGVVRDGRPLSEAEGEAPAQDAAPEVRARAGRLARATLRHGARADAVLKPHLSRPPRDDIRAILRLATVEMLAEGAAPYAVVNEAVRAARARQPKAAGMVNAVLRRVAETPAEAWAVPPAPRLPGWLRGRLSAAYGNARVAEMEAVFETTPPLDLTVKPGADATPLLDLGERLPTGSLRLDRAGQVSALPGYGAGAWWVQDAAAALPAWLTGAAPGQRVLDLCAAPGGKTMQLAAAGADVTALDISEARLGRLTENLARTGLTASVVVADALDWSPPAPFDAILLDAPCTATGTLRRHPDLPFVRRASDLKSLVALQSDLLDRAIGWLTPGGRLVYCTCSLLPDEGEAQIDAALERHPRLARVQDALEDLPGLDPAWRTGPAGTLRITPESWADRGGIDGFYIAALTLADA